MGTTMGTCGPGVAPSQECERHKALFLNLAEEAKTALIDLGATLNERLHNLEQQNEDLQEANAELQEQNDELQKEKTRLTEQVQQLDASLREKREQLWETIEDFKDEMKEKKRELREAEARQAEYRRVESVLREEIGSLQGNMHEQKEKLVQATKGFNEKERLNSEALERLEETVDQLERRLKTKDAEAASLQLLIRDQKASFSQATTRLNEKASKATTKKARLKEMVAQLERRLEAQSKAFEDERTQLTQEAAKWRDDAQSMQTAKSCRSDAQEKLNLSLDEAIPQLRSLLSAYDRIRSNQQSNVTQGKQAAAATKLGRAADQDMLQRLKEQEQAFDQERAQLLDQASDAAKTQRDAIQRSLMEREGLLTCPISLELFEFPVLTGCCGKTFSSEALRQAVSQSSPFCPFCRGQLVSTHANRDVTKLVELHRRERSVFGMSITEESTAATAASHSNEYAEISATAGRRRRSNGTSSGRQSRQKEHRRERVEARSEVPHRPSSISNTQDNAPMSSTSVAPSNPTQTTVVSATATNTTATTTNQNVQLSGLHIWRHGSDGPVAVPRNMVRSALSTLRFPGAQSQSTDTSRQRSRSSVQRSTASSRQRARSRTTDVLTDNSTASSEAATTAVTQQARSSTSRRRVSRSSTGSSVEATAVPTSNAASSSRRRTSRSSPSLSPSAVLSAAITGEPTIAASTGASVVATNAAQHSFISHAANGSQRSQSSRTSASRTARDSATSLDAWMKASLADEHPAPRASARTTTTNQLLRSSGRPNAAPATVSSSARSAASSTARSVASTATVSATVASRRIFRISATQDDSVLGRVKDESPRLTASQPAPRQSLSTLARSVTSLEDLLGSDFESISDSD